MNLLVIATAALLALGVLAVRAFLNYQHRQLFKPVRASAPLSPDPGDHGVDFESVQFGPDQRLHGWYLPLDAEAGTVLFCHGNRGNLSDRVTSCLLFRNMGFNVFALDYRGYGLSSGHPTEAGLYEDAFCAWEYLVRTRGVPPQNIALVGRSLGGAVASHLACRTRPAAVVLDATFSSVANMAREHYGHLPQWGLGRMKFANIDRIGQIPSPLLLVHSRDDAVIGFAHAEALQASAPDGTQLVEISGAHADGHLTSGAAYSEPVADFLEQSGLVRRPPAPVQTPLQRSL